MKFIFSILAALLFVSNIANASYVFVGSGGEGYESEGQLYTRDLYDYDLHKSPWFGNNRDPILEARLKKWNSLKLSELEIDLLLRKLTDLNSAYTYLGDDLLMTLEYFNWSYSDDPLVLLEPDEIRKPIDKTKRVSIANRFMNSIIINRDSFQRLDAPNKIALLLHETIYSLTSLNFLDTGKASVSLAAVRLMTSTLFEQTSLHSDSTEVLFKKQLRLFLESETFRAFTGSRVRVILADKSGSSRSRETQVFSLKGILADQQPLKEMCNAYLSNNLSPLGTVELNSLDKIVRSETYDHETGTQEALAVGVFTTGYHNFRLSTDDPETCSSLIAEAIRRRFTLKKD